MEKDIGKIKKNNDTEIIVRIDDFGGKKGLTIREYTTSERYTGFTKSGTRIPPESFKDFKALINAIDEKDLEGPVETKPAEPKDTNQSQLTSKKPSETKTKKSKKVEDVSDEDLL
jgi:hypothetical protein